MAFGDSMGDYLNESKAPLKAIWVSKELKEELLELKIIPEEPFQNVIERLLKAFKQDNRLLTEMSITSGVYETLPPKTLRTIEPIEMVEDNNGLFGVGGKRKLFGIEPNTELLTGKRKRK
jgi:predicted CopG family antitoxin